MEAQRHATMTGIVEPDGLLGSPGVRRHLGWTLLAGLALPLSALVTGPLLARTIGADGRGLIAAVVAPATVASTVSIAALPRSAVYHLAGASERYREVARESLRLGLVGGVLGALVWLAFSGVFLDGVPHQTLVRVIVVLLIPLAALGSVSVGLLGSIGRFGTMNVANASSALARLLVLVGLAAAGVLTVSTALWGFLIYEVGLSALQLGPVLAQYRRTERGEASGVRRPLIRYWASGWIGDVSSVAVRRLDIVILAAVVSPGELGYYVLAVSLAGVWALTVASLQRVVLPETRRTHDFGAVARLHRLFLALTAALIASSFVFADAVTQLLYGSGFDETARLFPVLLLGLGPIALLPLTSSVLDAVGAPGVRSLVRVFTAIVTVVGLAIAVPLAGVWGAAWTSIGSYLLAAGLTMFLAAHYGKLPVSDFLIPKRGDLSGLRPVRGGNR
jgi:O-antigen/teichoic acid export membrane protein